METMRISSGHTASPWTRKSAGRAHQVNGFTLIEILTAILILSIVVSMVLGSFDGLFSDADHLNAGSDLFEMGNTALNRIVSDLSGLHVMPYPRYKPPDIDDEPELYRLVGEVRSAGGQSFSWLRFASLSHLPLNQTGREGIAQIVYYVQETEDAGYVLKRADALYPYPEFEESDDDPVVCEQLRDFRISFIDEEGDMFEEWSSENDDTEYATPRAVGIRLAVGEAEAPFVFRTQVTLPVYRYQPVKR